MIARQSREGGTTRRQKRAGEFIRRTIGEMLVGSEFSDRELDVLSITITEVRVSADLREAKVFFLPLGGGDIEVARKALERNRGAMQRAAAFKFAPQLKFVADASFDRSDRIDTLIDEVSAR